VQVEIIDNFLDIQDQLQISNYINNFSYLENPHSYSFNVNAVTQDVINSNNLLQINNPQMVKPIFNIEVNTKKATIFDNFLFSKVYLGLNNNNLSNYFIQRIKINITFPHPKNTIENYGPIHTDDERKESKSIIYYINNSDGDTLFFNNNSDNPKIIKRISPKQGRAVVFNSNINHTACCPINAPYRQIINFVLYKK